MCRTIVLLVGGTCANGCRIIASERRRHPATFSGLASVTSATMVCGDLSDAVNISAAIEYVRRSVCVGVATRTRREGRACAALDGRASTVWADHLRGRRICGYETGLGLSILILSAVEDDVGTRGAASQ